MNSPTDLNILQENDMNKQQSNTPFDGGAVLAFLFVLIASPTAARAQQAPVKENPILESIEWTDIRVNNADKDDLPRVLFVGDSIVKGYFPAAEKELAGKANCGRLATSAFITHEDFLANLEIVLDRYRWDVIHINNGLHGWDYTERQYRDGFPMLAELLGTRAKDATIIWALTTPCGSGITWITSARNPPGGCANAMRSPPPSP